MNLVRYVSSFLFPRNLTVQSEAPGFSLTAQDGSWKRSIDHQSNRNVLLVGCKNLQSPETVQWLSDLNQEDFDSLDCTMYVIATLGTEQLRRYKNEHGLTFNLLYDPLGLEARKFGLTGRRPMLRDSCVLINKDWNVVHSNCGQTSSRELFKIAQQQLGFTEVQQEQELRVSSNAVQMISSEKAVSLLQDNPEYKIVDVRTTSEYEPDHVPGSVHMPVDEIHQRYEEIGQIHSLLFICQAGGRSYSAAEFLASIGGTSLLVVEGGMSGWSGPRKTDGKIS